MSSLDPLNDTLRWARFFATVKHAGQTYRGLPYTHHLAAVEAILRRFGATSQEMLEAAWLHDCMEDCGVKRKEISEMFGGGVAELVWSVTNEDGPNRKARAALTYPKTRSVDGGVCLKLADRIANVESGGDLVSMYKNEYEDFRRNLYTKNQYEDMWKHLDSLMGYVE